MNIPCTAMFQQVATEAADKATALPQSVSSVPGTVKCRDTGTHNPLATWQAEASCGWLSVKVAKLHLMSLWFCYS